METNQADVSQLVSEIDNVTSTLQEGGNIPPNVVMDLKEHIYGVLVGVNADAREAVRKNFQTDGHPAEVVTDFDQRLHNLANGIAESLVDPATHEATKVKLLHQLQGS